STAGQKLGDIRRIVVYRYSETPAATEPADAPFAKVPPIGQQRFTRQRQKLDTLEKAELPGSTSGAKLIYEDTPPLPTPDGRPVRINYAVVTEGASAKGEMSNIASIVPVRVPTPPEALAVNAQPEGLVLTWNAPAKDIEGRENPNIA